MNRLPNTIEASSDPHKVFVIQSPSERKSSKHYEKEPIPEEQQEHPKPKELKQIEKKIVKQEKKMNSREKKALHDLMKAWNYELTRTFEHRPSPCYPINPLTRRLINPPEFYDTLLKIFLINQEKEYHIDIPPIVNIFAYDRPKVFETYEDFLNRAPNCREKLRDYFFGKQLRFENGEWTNIPPIPLGYDFLAQSKALGENQYNPPVLNSKDVLEQEKNVILIPKLIQKTNKEQLFRLLDRYPEELKYFTPLEAQFFGFTKEEGEELVKVYLSKDKKLIKKFRDKILKREKKVKEQRGGNQKNDNAIHLLPYF